MTNGNARTYVSLPNFDFQKYVRPVGIGIAALIILFSSLRIVQAGTVQVVTQFGRVTGRTLKPGASFIIPFAERTLSYNVKKITYEASTNPKDSMATYKDFSVDTTTQDGQQISINYTVRFSINPDRAGWIASNIGNEADVVEKIVKTDSRIHVRNTARGFDAADLYTGKIEQTQDAITAVLSPIFVDNSLILDEFGIRSIKFTPEYVSAIEQKQIEKEQVITEQNKAKQEEFRKEARITRAEGQAEEQRLQRATLDPQVLEKISLDNQKAFIDKWNGVMPQIVGSENFLLDISKLAE